MVTEAADLSISRDGAPLTGEASCIVEMRVVQVLSAPTQMELVLTGSERETGSPDDWLGSALVARVGEGQRVLFDGDVLAAEVAYGARGQRTLYLRGYDRLHRLAKRQPVRCHVNVTLTELMESLVSPLGLTVHTVAEGPHWDRLLQHSQTDLALLIEAAMAGGLYVIVLGNELRAVTLAGEWEALDLTWGENLLEARVEHSGVHSCRQVQALGWNAFSAEPVRAVADSARVAPADRVSTVPSAVGGEAERTLANRPAGSVDTVDHVARSALDRAVSAEQTLWAVAEGDPALRPGRLVSLHGLDECVRGPYALTRVEHRLTAEQGYLSVLENVPPSASVTSLKGPDTTLGRVTRVDDPQGLARVCVALPAFDDLETDWLQVLLPAAGSGKGFMALPDVGDRVLVLMVSANPAEALVLGGLYGVDGPPESLIEDNRVARFVWRTPGGQRVALDDERESIVLTNRDGSELALTAQGVRLHGAQDLVIEAPGRAIRIRAESIDFEKA